MKRSIITALLFPLWGVGGLGLFAQSITIKPVDADYTTGTVKLSVAWNEAVITAGKVWIWIDYCPVNEETLEQCACYAPATLTGVTGNVASTSTRGFYVTANPSTVTATLNTASIAFNWCAYGSGAPPRAELQTDGSYLLKGTPPFTITYDDGASTTTTAINGDTFNLGCITAITDPTGHPGGIVDDKPNITAVTSPAVCYNTAAELSATVTGGTTTAMTYTWDIGGTVTITTDATKTTDDLTATTTYTVQARNAAGCTGALSDVGTITVYPEFQQTDPAGTTICYDATATFNLAAATGGSGAISYRWQNSADGSAGWANIDNATGAAYTTPALKSNMYYRRIATGATCGSATSARALVTVLDEFNAGAIDDAGEAVCYNAAPTAIGSSEAASGGSGTISYKWKHNNADIPDATAAGYDPAAYKADAGAHSFTRFAHDATCNTDWVQSSGTWVLTVHPEFTQTDPADTTICYNTTATFDLAEASGGYGAISYQWQKSTDGISNWTTADGTSTNAAYTTPALTGNMYYRRTAKGATCGADTSTGALVTVHPEFTQTDPAGTTVCYNTTATFNLAEATGGAGAISYQWQKSTDGSSGWANAEGTSTNAAYTTPALTGNMYYRRLATRATCGSATSARALVTVLAFPALTQNDPAGTTICPNTTATFNLAAATGGSGTISYRWQNSTDGIADWANIDNATSAAYTTPALTSNMYYRRIATGATCGSATSKGALVTVQAAMAIARDGGNASQTVNQKVAISSITYTAANASAITLYSGSFPAGLTGAWSSNRFVVSGSPTASGTFAYTVKTANSLSCPDATASGTITVNNLGVTFANCTAPSLPAFTAGFASTSTYVVNGLTISAPVTATYCSGRCNVFDSGSTGAFKADCAPSPQDGFGGHLFSWCMAKQYAAELCKSPWRVPTKADWCKVINNSTSSCNDKNVGYIGSYGFTNSGAANKGNCMESPTSAYYWSSDQYNSDNAHPLKLTSTTASPGDWALKYYGYALRCVR